MKYTTLVLITLLSFFAGCASRQDKNVLARFDGTVITQSDFTERLSLFPKELRSVALRRKKDFINEMVDEHFLVKEAKKQNIENLPDVKELIAAARKKIIVSKLIELEVDKR